MSDLVPVKRALISVSDKTGLAEFATALVKEFGVELISTGGTSKFLRDAGLPVKDVSDVTGFPEMMDGRVKTLHPKIHGGLLALRDHADHVASMKAHDIQPIDLVIINLYPFKKTIEKPGVTFEEAIENIDIGGPSMVRSASKNHRFVLVVTDPARYDKVLGDMREHKGSTCGKHRLKMAQAAFQHTAEYDALIAGYLAESLEVLGKDESAPARPIAYKKPVHIERITQSARKSIGERMETLAKVMALQIRGTEAAAFSVVKAEGDHNLITQAHIRPDSCGQAVREKALKAFNNVVTECVKQERDGLIKVSLDELPDQYCLVVLLREAGIIDGAITVIARAKDQEEANQHHNRISLIARYYERLSNEVPQNFPTVLRQELLQQQLLRYGENPHQKAALYTTNVPNEASVAFADQLHGKELSYINLLDADAALSAVKEFNGPAACVVKHATPCGCATATELSVAFQNAYDGDPLAAFGGIVAVNRPIDIATAQKIVEGQKFLEVIVAPSYSDDALQLLKDRWKNCRLLAVGEVKPLSTAADDGYTMHKIIGGYLVQERDWTGLNESDWKVVSDRKPTESELNDLRAAWLICKHIKSNAIVVAKNAAAVGIGGGQVDRVNASRVAVQKAGERAKGAVVASDAFFPFPDGPEILLNAGVTAIIHPGGSVRDNETIALANQRNAVVILTGQRHFRH